MGQEHRNADTGQLVLGWGAQQKTPWRPKENLDPARRTPEMPPHGTGVPFYAAQLRGSRSVQLWTLNTFLPLRHWEPI